MSLPSPPQLLLSGLDSLYVSFFLDTATCDLDWDDLQYRKEKAGRERNGGFEEVRLGTERFALKPFGKHPYRYVLANRDFEVRLSEGLSPSCYVQFLSQALWSQGASDLMERFDLWRASVGLSEVKPESISRADFAFDYALSSVDFSPSDLVSRATKKATWEEHNSIQTVQCGTGATVVRLYDKVAEIEQQSDKAWFFDFWGQSRNVWRIEFQVRSPRLKEGGIRTFADLQDLQIDLLRELATKHTTLRRANGDSNRSRWPFHPLWAQLVANIEHGAQTGLIRAYDEMAGPEWRLDRNGRSVFGYLKQIAALIQVIERRNEPLSLPDIIDRLPSIVGRYHQNDLWNEEVLRRVSAIELGQ
ncbi:MAG: hypothetical protein ACPGOV_14815 [Magnetovibrionaceae bacterium]